MLEFSYRRLGWFQQGVVVLCVLFGQQVAAQAQVSLTQRRGLTELKTALQKAIALQESESVSFSADLAQVFNERCTSCHGTNQPRARLSLATFRSLMRGGNNGPPVSPGDPEGSLLVQKLKGTADGQRMPQGGPPLSDDLIARFETWIREGAKFDGRDPNQDVREIAAIAKARLATHEQLRADREILAQQNWRLIMPDNPPEKVATEHFLLVGNVGSGELTEYGAVAEKLVPRVGKLFRVPGDSPLVKGAMTLFFFKSRYDYGELGRMVEKRDIEPTTRAHCRYSIVDAYAALYVTGLDSDSLEAILAQQIAGLYVASLGPSPEWFRRGAARAAAARLVPRSEQVASWNDALASAFQRQEKPDDFIAGRSTAADANVLAFSYVEFLMGESGRFQNLIGKLREGTDFDAAFAQCFGAAPEQVAAIWARRTASDMWRRSRRSGR